MMSIVARFSLLLLFSTGLPGAQDVPQDARRELLKAWDTHGIVAVTEWHRGVQDKEFLLTLITHPEFSSKVNDVVVEFGNARLQPLLDRYMEGGRVSLDQLRRVWADTTAVTGVWDAPVYEQFFTAVRKHNQTLPKRRRIRVIACDPPIDWKKVQTISDAVPFLSRDPFCASLIEREVIAKGRKALLIMGDAHLNRRHITGRPVKNVVTLLEPKHPGAVHVVVTYAGQFKESASIEERLRDGPIPSLSLLRGTSIGTLLAIPPKPPVRTRMGAGPPTSETVVVTDPPRLEDVADGLLYLGPKSIFTRSIPSEDRFTPEELRELDRRHQILFKIPLDRNLVFQ